MKIAVSATLKVRVAELVYGIVTQEMVGTVSTGGDTHATHVHVYAYMPMMREGWVFVKVQSQAKEVSFP